MEQESTCGAGRAGRGGAGLSAPGSAGPTAHRTGERVKGAAGQVNPSPRGGVCFGRFFICPGHLLLRQVQLGLGKALALGDQKVRLDLGSGGEGEAAVALRAAAREGRGGGQKRRGPGVGWAARGGAMQARREAQRGTCHQLRQRGTARRTHRPLLLHGRDLALGPPVHACRYRRRRRRRAAAGGGRAGKGARWDAGGSGRCAAAVCCRSGGRRARCSMQGRAGSLPTTTEQQRKKGNSRRTHSRTLGGALSSDFSSVGRTRAANRATNSAWVSAANWLMAAQLCTAAQAGKGEGEGCKSDGAQRRQRDRGRRRRAQGARRRPATAGMSSRAPWPRCCCCPSRSGPHSP